MKKRVLVSVLCLVFGLLCALGCEKKSEEEKVLDDLTKQLDKTGKEVKKAAEQTQEALEKKAEEMDKD